MTKPESVEPPKLAKWLLERLSPQNEPLAGDLIEAFGRGDRPVGTGGRYLWLF